MKHASPVLWKRQVNVAEMDCPVEPMGGQLHKREGKSHKTHLVGWALNRRAAESGILSTKDK